MRVSFPGTLTAWHVVFSHPAWLYCKSWDAATPVEGNYADLRCRETWPREGNGNQKPTSTRRSRDESWDKGDHNSGFTDAPLGSSHPSPLLQSLKCHSERRIQHSLFQSYNHAAPGAVSCIAVGFHFRPVQAHCQGDAQNVACLFCSEV